MTLTNSLRENNDLDQQQAYNVNVNPIPVKILIKSFYLNIYWLC